MAFDHAELTAAWEPLAKDRSCLFKWDGSLYSKPCRNLSADQDTLIVHKDPLEILLSLAPTGFPAQRSVEKALEKLHLGFNILECKAKELNIVISEAADCWRIMCKHIYTLTQDKVKAKPGLQELLDLVHGESQAEASVQEEPLSIEETRRMFEDFDEPDTPDIEMEDEVMITNVTCQCEDCNMGVASAKRGGQRQETKPKEKTLASIGKVAIVSRKGTKKNKNSGSYLMVDGKFFVGLSAFKSADHRSILEDIAKKIESGEVASVSEAKAAIAAILSS